MKRLPMILAIASICALCACSKPVSDTKTSSKNSAEIKSSSAESIQTSAQLRELKGIDVSAYSGEIDWKKVKNSGVEFAMIRVGGRGWGESGALYADDSALKNLREAKDNDVLVGAYFYSQAISDEEAREEAQYALSLLDGEKLDLPLAYDFEYVKDDEARTDEITIEQRNGFSDAFCEEIKKAGVEPMVYSYTEDIEKGVKTDYPLWLADYENKSSAEYAMKQYSTEGKIDGISGSVDLDIYLTNN